MAVMQAEPVALAGLRYDLRGDGGRTSIMSENRTACWVPSRAYGAGREGEGRRGVVVKVRETG